MLNNKVHFIQSIAPNYGNIIMIMDIIAEMTLSQRSL